ncbi:MAG TPA: multiheme c-type cytochrome [Polyangiales bacterium]|nr:multiheme c-type cytochrome [Polyangiales bacterium]
MTRLTRALAGAFLLLVAASCGTDDLSVRLTREQLLDPETCKGCHPKHYDEWSASMHAYASRDPVFIAMNKRMQEQAPENAQFCVQCHAPMAVRENAIPNLSDPSTIPAHLQGVTCYFCHNVVDVKSEHFNANLVLANDTIMRGALGNPVASAAPHGVMPTSKWHDPSGIESSQMCGTCHDIKAPSGKFIERTFQEYEMSLSAQPGPGRFNSCSDCHMRPKPKEELAAVGVDGVGQRKVHSHLFPAVDIALTPDMPNQDALRQVIEKSELQACTLSMFEVEIGDWRPGEPFEFVAQVEHIAGHSIPSGAAADRRMWLEFVATDEAGQVVFKTGQIADGEVEEKPDTDPKYDPQFRPFRDHLIDKDGNETHMFWEAVDYKTDLMPYATDPNPAITHTAQRTFRGAPLLKVPVRMEGWIRLRPMGIDVLQDLVQSGHLDPAVISAMPTLTVAHYEFVLNPSNQTYKGQSLLTDAECKQFKTLSDVTAAQPQM